MNHIIPQAAYAEDQPHSRALLITHVLHRSVPTGCVLGVLSTTSRHLLKSGFTRSPFSTARLLSGSAIGVVYTVPIVGALMVGRMWGCEEIGWQDRAWRLLGNPFQNQTDEWSAGGMVLGAVAGGAALRRAGVAAWRGPVGGAGVGSLLGVGAMLVWRAVRGGPGEIEGASKV